VTAHTAGSADEWSNLARRAEDLGYATFVVPDHFNDQLAPVPALTAAASATSRLRVGSMVFANDFRHPVVLAKELATLDRLSDGRLEWGMGAGWLPTDFESTGLTYDPAGRRVGRMFESVSVMKRLFANGPLDHDGEHYSIAGLDGLPKPVQRPHPPLLIGAAQPRMLAFAGREADAIGISPSMTSRQFGPRPPLESVTESTDRQLECIRAAAGDRFDQIELNMVTFPAAVVPNREAMADNLTTPLNLSAAEVLASPHVLIGTVDEICEQLEQRRERWGISYWAVASAVMDQFAPVIERLAGR
jgi:probable F420-dependent oxidoreductase